MARISAVLTESDLCATNLGSTFCADSYFAFSRLSVRVSEYPSRRCISTYNDIWLLHGWCQVKLLPSWRTISAHHTTVH